MALDAPLNWGMGLRWCIRQNRSIETAWFRGIFIKARAHDSIVAMNKISAKYQLFFPLVWFALSAFYVVKAIMEGKDPMHIVGICIAGVVIFILMMILRKFLMKLVPGYRVDEVYDCGDFLLIKHRGEEDRVALSNIMNVKAWTTMFPPVVTLQLVNPGKFDAVISFVPRAPFTISPFVTYPIVEDLTVRVDRARSKRVL